MIGPTDLLHPSPAAVISTKLEFSASVGFIHKEPKITHSKFLKITSVAGHIITIRQLSIGSTTLIYRASS
jgi:hypothetical protein